MRMFVLLAALSKCAELTKLTGAANPPKLTRTLSAMANASPRHDNLEICNNDKKESSKSVETSFPRSVQLLFAYDEIMKNRQMELKLIRSGKNLSMRPNPNQNFSKVQKQLVVEDKRQARFAKIEDNSLQKIRESRKMSSSRKRLNFAVSSRVMSTTTPNRTNPDATPCKSRHCALLSRHCALLNGNVCEATPQGMKATPEQEALHFKQRLASVTGLSERVLKVSKEPVGPGARKGNKSKYKNPEFYSYHPLSFYEAEVELSCYRLPQPSNKQKPEFEGACS